MTHQMALFGDGSEPVAVPTIPTIPVLAVASSPTSRAAAESVRPRAGSQAERVLAFVTDQADYGATDLEIQKSLNLPGDTQRPRRVALVRAGLLVDSGNTRTTPTGRDAVVWIVPEGLR